MSIIYSELQALLSLLAFWLCVYQNNYTYKLVYSDVHKKNLAKPNKPVPYTIINIIVAMREPHHT
jgi:hypothetical protein